MNYINRTGKRKGPTSEKSFLFAIKVVGVYKELLSQNEYVLSKQLLRSGTAIGALVRESQRAESAEDFIHKLAIAQKEAEETLYWIDLLYETDYISADVHLTLVEKADELMRLITSSILTMKKKIQSTQHSRLSA